MKSCSPWVMGILNVTPDSFSDGGKFLSQEKALIHARQMIAQGADIIDLGGESTRPGAEAVSLQEELDRVLPVVELLKKESPIPLSIDTTKYEVAKESLALGAKIINDVSGGADSRLLTLLSQDPEVHLILVHRKGTPKTMQENPEYPLGVTSEVKETLSSKVKALAEMGVESERLWLDPGIGFGKTVNQNLELLRDLHQCVGLAGRVVIGTSRKAFLGTLLPSQKASMEEREAGTLASHLWAYQQGASVFRVHDVGAMKRALTTWDAIRYGC
jgi:dihydropteroate synthase